MSETIDQDPNKQLKSFDVLASVNMMRFDIEHYGLIQGETRNRIKDEELSYLTEGVGRAARTTFILQRQNEDIVYFKNGEWRPYIGMLLTGQTVAHSEAEADPRRQFLAADADEEVGCESGN